MSQIVLGFIALLAIVAIMVLIALAGFDIEIRKARRRRAKILRGADDDNGGRD